MASFPEYREGQIVFISEYLRCLWMVERQYGYVDRIAAAACKAIFKFPDERSRFLGNTNHDAWPEIVAQPEDIKRGFRFKWEAASGEEDIVEWEILSENRNCVRAMQAPDHEWGYSWTSREAFYKETVLSSSFEILPPKPALKVSDLELAWGKSKLETLQRDFLLLQEAQTWSPKFYPQLPTRTPDNTFTNEAVATEVTPQCPKMESLYKRCVPPHPTLMEEIRQEGMRVAVSKYREWPCCPAHETPLTLKVTASPKQGSWANAYLSCPKDGWAPKVEI